MAAYLIARTKLTDIDSPADATGSLAEYFAKAPACVEDGGGKFIVRGGQSEVLEGEDRFSPCMIVQFDSYDEARQWYFSEEYTRLKALRMGHADVDVLLVDGC